MPYLVGSILGGLISLMGSLIGRAILALGFGFVEYAGISTLVAYVIAQANSAFGNFAGSSAMMAWAGFFRIDIHVSILISAIGVKLLMNSLGGATVRRLIQK